MKLIFLKNPEFFDAETVRKLKIVHDIAQLENKMKKQYIDAPRHPSISLLKDVSIHLCW
jgi:hypothetical protein